eukprot:TRINITY_DN13506_c0_g2_i9.p1 TRINITY_DN13506_c0_g2~~TRINITY_DN13506_c0_g2_i9.p1  ORF type:complete len:316 (-),score=48.91 TRINITY_DN13506_c0_g2_i9:240-1187(-)
MQCKQSKVTSVSQLKCQRRYRQNTRSCQVVQCQQKVEQTQLRTRRWLLSSCIIVGFPIAVVSPQKTQALPKGSVDARIAEAFNKALVAGGDYKTADSAWSEAIDMDPSNSAAWSNRATTRLQAGRWQDAKADFLTSLELEQKGADDVSALLYNNLGNAQGACGEWEDAMKSYLQASKDPELEEIALANYALALFEIGKDEQSERQIRSLLRKDPQFLDMKCALVASVWAQGKNSAAEGEWQSLQEAQDGLGQTLYSSVEAVDRVKSRWPPRPTAALEAFIAVSRQGLAVGYDGKTRKYDFSILDEEFKDAEGQVI